MLLWVFSGQAQWLLFMTLCRGFMTGARQPPAQLPPAPRAQPPPRPSALGRGGPALAPALGRAQAHAHAAHAADHAPLNTRTLLGVSLAHISPTSRPHLAHISPASLPHLARTTAGIVVFATHYGEDILDGGDHGLTLVEQTALTSRNITGGHAMNVRCSRATSNPTSP